LTAHHAAIDLIVSLHRSLTRRGQSNKTGHMSINSLDHSIARRLAASLLAAAITLSTAAASFAADAVVLRVGDQKGGNRSLLEISGYAKDLPYKIEWSEFPAAAPILEALNAGALDVGYTGDLSFLSVYAAGAPIKAIGGTRSDAKTQASSCARIPRSNRPPTSRENASPARAAAGASF
jgi:sulfonate transport system substrate-binding protein